MKTRRAGNGCSSGIAPVETSPIATSSPTTHPRTTLGDDPRIAAALRYAGDDVRAYEQTEAAWKRVWGVEESGQRGESSSEISQEIHSLITCPDNGARTPREGHEP